MPDRMGCIVRLAKDHKIKCLIYKAGRVRIWFGLFDCLCFSTVFERLQLRRFNLDSGSNLIFAGFSFSRPVFFIFFRFANYLPIDNGEL